MLAALATGCAQLPREAAPDLVERFADATVQLLPIGQVMDVAAANDARWPLAAKAALVSAPQLACMREALSSAKVTPRQRQTARGYAQAHPEQLSAELQVLEAGAARLIGQSVLAGAKDASAAGAPPAASASERAALVAFVTEPRFDRLRRATGIDRLAGASGADSAAERGRKLGTALLTPLMTDAFLQCHIPVKLLY